MTAVPSHVLESVRCFHNALIALDDAMKRRDELPLTEEHIEDNPLDRARLDLTTLFVVNSAMWMKMCTRGETPSQNDELKNELKRIKEQMARMKMIEEKKHAPRINPKVAGRFVRNALWDADE